LNLTSILPFLLPSATHTVNIQWLCRSC